MNPVRAFVTAGIVAIIVASAAAQVVRPPTARAGAGGGPGGEATQAGGNSTSGTASGGQTGSLEGTIKVIPGPVFQEPVQPAIVSPSFAPAPARAIIPGGRSCRQKSFEECANEAATCLAQKAVERTYGVTWIDNRPWVSAPSSYPSEQEKDRAAECAGDLQRCLLPC